MNRIVLVLVVSAGCLEPEPAREYALTLTYNGERSEAAVDFPPYSYSVDQPASIPGTIRGDAPIVFANAMAAEVITLTFGIERLPDDPGDVGHPNVECIVEEADVGHATACNFSTHACSLVVIEVRR